jgi:hypothetical protein
VPNPSLTAVTGTTSGSTTAVTASVPASVVNNSVVLVVIITSQGTSTITGLGTTGLVHAPGSPLASAGNNVTLNVLWKRSNGTEPGSYALTASAGIAFWAAGSARIDNAITSGSIWDTNSGTGAALNSSVSANSLTTSMTTQAANELLINAAAQFNGGVWTQPAGFTKDFTDSAAPGVVYFADLLKAVAGATGTLTTSVSGGATQMADWLGAILGNLAATYVPPIVGPRRLRLPSRRGHIISIRPVQVATPPPPPPIQMMRAVTRRLKARRSFITSLPQVQAPAPQMERAVTRRLPPRRGRVVTAPLTQVVVVQATPPPQLTRGRVRLLLQRRGRLMQVPIAQVVVAPQPPPPQLTHIKTRVLSRRGHVTQVPIAQVAIITPPTPPQLTRSRARLLLTRRARVVEVPVTQVAAPPPPVPPWLSRAQARKIVARRGGHVTQLVPLQVSVPVLAPTPRLMRKRLAPRRGRIIVGGEAPSSGNDGNAMFVLMGGLR